MSYFNDQENKLGSLDLKANTKVKRLQSRDLGSLIKHTDNSHHEGVDRRIDYYLIGSVEKAAVRSRWDKKLKIDTNDIIHKIKNKKIEKYSLKKFLCKDLELQVWDLANILNYDRKALGSLLNKTMKRSKRLYEKVNKTFGLPESVKWT